jgi:hypothetical protein
MSRAAGKHDVAGPPVADDKKGKGFAKGFVIPEGNPLRLVRQT